MTDQTRKELAARGESIRRKVLGSKYVDAALNNATDFSRPLQEMLNEYCWGAGWGREGGLSMRERSIIVLSILTALGRSHEVKAHTRGALNNGMTPAEIASVFLHAAIYAGVPAAVDSFRSAAEVIAEHGK
ncbi:MAG TPA: carboxymuconolactone decarboxylase family protein [Steroidobacteraceae bacterium]|nr:carboxymuconolactone decarboxylase family protein [Steroidobacteraceae bacterium]